ncbi:DUF4232 domain-containing protein [Arthrobacter pityocampae]|uniref:DUF4232 domain-containing protein n=1 Tax=Arthrobacter pityocampae TaxID=547334 RepID=UPI0011B07862|nr:DUF4232 domain-containing protein [Arthrobacter pityocampae]
MTTLLGSNRWIAAIAAAGALIAVSGCSASDPGSGEPAASTSEIATAAPTASDVPSASPSASPSAEATADASATTAAPGPTTEATASPSATSAPADPSPSATPSASPEAAVGTCTAAQLTGSIQDQAGGGAAGSVYRTLVLTNASGQPCTVAGYPGVSSVDGAGNQIGAPADRDGTTSAPVLLAPGASASATLRQANAQNYGADCGLTPAAGLRVYPPGATDSLILPQELPACSAASIVLLTVSPLQPAA